MGQCAPLTGSPTDQEKRWKTDKKQVLTKVLVVLGCVLAWLPLAAPLVLGLFPLFGEGRYLLDYLMPAELFPVALAGGGLLLWAARRARAFWKGMTVCLAAMVLFLVGGQALAVASGLASGAVEPAGWPLALVLAALGLYALALLAVGILGIRLAWRVFRAKP